LKVREIKLAKNSCSKLKDYQLTKGMQVAIFDDELLLGQVHTLYMMVHGENED